MSEFRPVLFGPKGETAWKPLSNFYPAPIEVDGQVYSTVEHYYQAAKALTEDEHEVIRTAESPAVAKKLGRRCQLLPDWKDCKIDIMRTALLAKFRQHPDLRKLLLSTGNRPIHEASRHDAIWGWMDGQGQDLLGKVLVEVRSAIRRESVPAEPLNR